MELGGRQQVGRASLAAELDELDHRGILPLEHPAVAVNLVDRPGADHAGVGPGGPAVVAGDLHRRDHRELAVGALAVGQVDQPLGEEGLDVAVERGRADVDLGVARPAQPLVALGAVGGDVDEVGPLGPVDVAVQLVEHRVGALEPADDGRVAGEGDAGDRVSVGGASSPVISTYWKPWKVNRGDQVSSSPACADVGVDAAGFAEVGGVDRAVGVEPLGEPKRDLLPGFARDLQPGHAGEVLAQVEHVDTGLRLGDRCAARDGLELGEGPHRRAGMGLDHGIQLGADGPPAPTCQSSKPGVSQPGMASRAS